MSKLSRSTRWQVAIIILLALAMAVSYLAGTISVEARWFSQDNERATTNQIAAVSAIVSLLLLGEEEGGIIYLPIIVR